MTEVINLLTSLSNDGVPAGSITTQYLVARQATAIPTITSAVATATSVANAVASTALDIKAAWSSPGNCLQSNYCRIPVAIIIFMGVLMIIGCLCCLKSCADCIACCCCCCRSSARSRERLRPPDAQGYATTNYGYAPQPPPYYSRARAGGGSLFPMPERPKYERLGDEEHGIKLDDMRPKHAYVDGDNVVSKPPVEKDMSPISPANAPVPVRMPRAPTAPYPLTDDGYHTPPPAFLPGVNQASGPQSPFRQASPVRPSYADDYTYAGGAYPNQPHDNYYRDGGRGNGGGQHGDRDQYYENSRGGYGESRGGGFNV